MIFLEILKVMIECSLSIVGGKNIVYLWVLENILFFLFFFDYVEGVERVGDIFFFC